MKYQILNKFVLSTSYFFLDYISKENCKWAEWRDWSNCTSVCTELSNNGNCSICTKTRIRQFEYPHVSSKNPCLGDDEEKSECLKDEPCTGKQFV